MHVDSKLINLFQSDKVESTLKSHSVLK